MFIGDTGTKGPWEGCPGLGQLPELYCQLPGGVWKVEDRWQRVIDMGGRRGAVESFRTTPQLNWLQQPGDCALVGFGSVGRQSSIA